MAGVAALMAGCANDGNTGGPPGRTLPVGECNQMRSELSRLDARGVPSIVEQVNAGRKVSASNRELADRYRQLLDKYLGARCHI